MIKKIKFLFFIMVLMFIFDLCLADIIGTKTDENYTYTSYSSTDIIYTSTMVFTSEYTIQLDTQNATGLTVKSENENFNYWINDAILSINGNVEIDKINLINNSLIDISNLVVNASSVTTNYIIYADMITNNGYVNLANNNYKYDVSDYYYYHNYSLIKGNGVLEISTNIINSASIKQKELLISSPDVEFYNQANIEVSTFTNNGIFINEFEDEEIIEGTINADNIINNGTFYFYMTGKENTAAIKMSSETSKGVTFFINNSVSTTTISTNSSSVEQYGVITWGSFYNQAPIAANFYENNGIIYNFATITVSTFTNNASFYTAAENIVLVDTNVLTNNEYLEITGGTNTYKIIGSSGIIAFGSDKNSVTKNAGEIFQSTMVVQGTFTNIANIKLKEDLINYGNLINNTEIEIINYYINYGTTTNNGKIKTYEIENSSDGIFETDINNIEVNSFTNFGKLNLTGDGTNNIYIVAVTTTNVLMGTTTITGQITNNNIIAQSYIINEGSITTNYRIYADTITNNGYINLANNTYVDEYDYYYNISAIEGTGILEISTHVVNFDSITQNKLIINEGSSFQSPIDSLNIAEGITNNGIFYVFGGINTNKIMGSSGTTMFVNISTETLSVSTNSANIEQKSVINYGHLYNLSSITAEIYENNGLTYSSGTIKVSTFTNNGIFVNQAGVIDVSTFTNIGNFINQANIVSEYFENLVIVDSSGTIVGLSRFQNSGTIEISTFTNYGIFTNEFEDIDGNINVSSFTNYGYFYTNADNIILTNTNVIANEGIFYITGGKNTNVITGSDGITVFNISSTTVSTNSANIEQYEVVSQGEFYNEAIIKAKIYENYDLANSSGTIEVSTFTNKGDFINHADVISDYFENSVTIDTTTKEIISTSTLQNVGKITVSSFTNYGNIVNESSITSSNMFFNDGNLTNNSEATIYSTKYFVNSGTTTNNGNISALVVQNQGIIKNEGIIKAEESIINFEDAEFDTDISSISVTNNSIANFGNLNLRGNGENINYINGYYREKETDPLVLKGTTKITGEIFNSGLIVQNYVVNEGTITTSLRNLYSKKIKNDGKINLIGEMFYDNVANNMNIEGSGCVSISTSITFYTKSDSLNIATLENNGALIFNGDSTVSRSTITGSGILYIGVNINSEGYLEKANKRVEIESTGGIEQNFIRIFQNVFLNADGNRFTADWIVNDGVLNLSNKNINLKNTYLQGDGSIIGDVVIGSSSTLSPGNSIGNFTIQGNLTFDSNSTYRVKFGDDYSDSVTDYFGNIIINPGSKAEFVVLPEYSQKYFEHKTYEILWTTSTLSGGFDEISLSGYDIDVSSISDLKEARITYSTQTVAGIMQVTLKRKGTEYSKSADLSNMTDAQKAVAEAVDIISLKSNTGSVANLLSTMESYYYYNSTYNLEKLKDIFTSLSGTIYANSAIAPFLNARYEHIYDKIYMTEEIKDYVDEYYEDGEEYYETKRNIWAQYYYNYYDVSGNQSYSGYDDTVQGFYAGYDISSSKNKLLGIVVGYADGLLKQKYDKTKVKSANLGAYVGYTKNKFQLKSLAMLGYDMYETERQTGATADYNGYNFSFDIEANYNFALKENFEIKPFAGILTNFSKQDSFSEKNAQSLSLSVDENTNLLSQARIGVDVKGKVKLLNWYARLGIKQFLTQNYAEAKIRIGDTGTGFDLKGTELSSTIFNIGFGGDYYLSEYWTAFANLHFGIGSGNSNDYYGNIGIKYKFGAINRVKDYIIR